MRGTRWRRVPWVFLICLCSCLLWPVVLGGEETKTRVLPQSSTTRQTLTINISPEIPPTIKNKTIFKETNSCKSTNSTDTTITKKKMSLSVYITSKPVKSTASLKMEINKRKKRQTSNDSEAEVTQITSASSQITSAPSQDHHTESTKTTGRSQNSIITEASTSMPSSAPSTHSSSTSISEKTSPSRKTPTASSSGVGNTPLTTTQISTAPTSADTTVGQGVDIPSSVPTSSTPVTSAVLMTSAVDEKTTNVEQQTKAPSSSTSTQETSASSQDQHTESTKTTGRSQTSIIAEESTSMPSAASSTSRVPQETSSSGNEPTFTPSSVSHTILTTPETLTAPTSKDTSAEQRVDISPSVTTTPVPVTSAVLISNAVNEKTTKVDKETKAPSSSTITQETSASSQDHHTEGTKTTGGSHTTIFTDASTSMPSSAPSTHSSSTSISEKTSPSRKTPPSSSSGVGNTPLTTTQISTAPTSADTTVGQGVDIPSSVPTSSTPVTSAVLMTSAVDEKTTNVEQQTKAPSSSTSTQETSASSQDQHTESTKTTGRSQTSIIAEESTSMPSSASNTHTAPAFVPQETLSLDKKATSSSPTFGHTPLTKSQMLIAPTSVDSSIGKLDGMSLSVAAAATTFTSAVITTSHVDEETTNADGQKTASTFSFFSLETSPSSLDLPSQITEIIRESENSTISAVSTSTSSSPSEHTLTEGHFQETYSTDKTSASLPSFGISIIPLTTSEILTAPTSTHTTVVNTMDTSLPSSRSITSLTSTASMPTGLLEQSEAFSPSTSTQETSASSQNYQTQIIKITGESELSKITIATTSTSVFSPLEHNQSGSISLETSSSNEKMTSSSFSVTNIPLTTSEMLTAPTSRDTSIENTWETSLSVTSFPAFTSKVSTTLSTSTFPQESSAIPQIGYTQSTQSTQGSQTISLVSPITDTIKTVTSATSSFKPSGHSLSESVPRDISTISEMTTFTPAPPIDSHTTQVIATATEIWTVPTSSDTTQGTSGGTSFSITSIIPQTTSVVSTLGGSEGQSTSPVTSISPDVVSAISQSHQTQGTETAGELHTSTAASLAVATTLVGTVTASSSIANSQTTSESSSPEKFTSDKTKNFSTNPSRESHITQSTTELLSTATSHDTTPGTMGIMSVTISSNVSTITSEVLTTGRPTRQSISTSPSTSPQETSAISQMAQTQSTGTTRGSETVSLVSQVTNTFSRVTSPFTPNVHTAPQTVTHTLSPSSTSTTLISNPVRDSHRTQTAMPALSLGATDGPTTVSSINLSNTASCTPSTILSPSGEVLTTTSSSIIHKSMTAEVIPTIGSRSNFLTKTMQDSASSVGESSTQTPEHPVTIQMVASNTNPITRHTYMSSTSNHNSIAGSIPTLSFPLTTYPLIKTTPATSSASKYSKSPTLQPSTDYAFSDSTSSGNVGKAQTISSFYTSTSNSSFSQSAPGPAVTWNSNTLFSGHSMPLSGTSTYPPSTASPSSTVKTETSGTITVSQKTDIKRSTATPSTTSQILTTSNPSTSTGTSSTTAVPIPTKPEKGVSLFPYGSSVGDREFVRRSVDFTSPLFEPRIGFPFGSSLRNFLYFTDNGQIIFPESRYQIFSYPNPLLKGFTGGDRVALVAPFWDDADFSSRWGTTFYQEYETLYDDDYRPRVVQQVESWIKRFTNTWNYKARWTLKVTWVNAPAYPAQWTFGTNTYQAILTTDGSRSFTLFLYQSGGMQWDMTQLPGSRVLMGFSSGDGYYENSPLTFQPVWERYRPDQFLDSNSGLRGLQVYRLHREERPNYRLRCLQWLKRQPQWPGWDWNQISCPCSWQQGLWDLRFLPVHTGWWGLRSRQLCSFSSWRGGACCSYGPWGEFLEGWRVQSPWQFDQELEPQQWCCHWNDQPSLCAMYQQRWPRISCAGYQPPRPAWMFGDPHITTLDHANYTFNGLGDFLLVQAQDGNSSFLLQGRTAQTGSAQASNFIAFAAQYNSSSLDSITVQWFLEPDDTIQVRLNNQTVTFDSNREDAEGQEIFNTTGVVLSRNGSMVSASLDGTVTISVIALSNILHASCSLPEEYRNRTEGLLGVWNDNPDDDFKMPNDTIIPKESNEETLFHYGMTWKIDGTSLLGKRDNNLPSNFTPVFISQLLKNNSSSENLTSECHGNKQCIYDILVTGNTSTGLHTKMLFSSYQQMNATLNQYPPSINGRRLVEAYMGQTTLIQYNSSSTNVTFTLRNNYADFKLFENGTLLWTPKSLEPFTLEILARNIKDNLSSVLQPKTVVCACKREKQCLYNQTSGMSNSSMEVAGCACDGNTFGQYCEHTKDPCAEQCFPNVKCIPGKGCEACPLHMTGDGRHCAPLEDSKLCQNTSCPVNYCYNDGHCYISQTLNCQPACICPQAFTDTQCFLAGNNFTPAIEPGLPLRIIQLSLSEGKNASKSEVNSSVAYILGNLDVRAFLWNSRVEKIDPPAALASGSILQYWRVISEFQYRPQGPVIDFLNNQLLDAVVEAFLLQALRRRWKRSEGPNNDDVVFHPISRKDISSLNALNVSTLEAYFKCKGYKKYRLVYSPYSGFTCMSPCSEDYCEHGGQCQHLPDGPHCSCVPFSIYTPWGDRCEHLSMKLSAVLGILFGTLGALLLLGTAVFVVLRFWSYRTQCSYPLDSES